MVLSGSDVLLLMNLLFLATLLPFSFVPDDPWSGLNWSIDPSQPVAGQSISIEVFHTLPSPYEYLEDPSVSIEGRDVILDANIYSNPFVSINPPIPVTTRFTVPPLESGTYMVRYYGDREVALPNYPGVTGTLTVAAIAPIEWPAYALLLLGMSGVGLFALSKNRRHQRP